MATEEQITSMLSLMQKQMESMQAHQEENAQLRMQQPPPLASTDGKTRRPDRPRVEANINDNDWALFEDTWKRYKIMARIRDDAEIRMELRAACSPDVNKLLF